MKRNLPGGVVVALIFCTQIALAHHAAATKYDENKPITVKGTVTKLEWLNPHVYFYVDVKDSSGKLRYTNSRKDDAPQTGSASLMVARAVEALRAINKGKKK